MACLLLIGSAMRKFVLGLSTLVLIACGSTPKKKTAAVEPSRSGQQAQTPAASTNKGDVTLTTNTGDDLSWLAPVYFELDSSDLLPQTRDTLARLHAWLAEHQKTTLTIEGHCDEQGTTEYNIGLGQRRAQAMVDYLARLGTQSSRLTPVSYGAERPAVDGHDEIAWAKNRRGEFRVSK